MSKPKRRKSNIQSIVVGAKQLPSPSTGSKSSPNLSRCQEVLDNPYLEGTRYHEEWNAHKDYLNPYKPNTSSWKEWEKAAGR